MIDFKKEMSNCHPNKTKIPTRMVKIAAKQEKDLQKFWFCTVEEVLGII